MLRTWRRIYKKQRSLTRQFTGISSLFLITGWEEKDTQKNRCLGNWRYTWIPSFQGQYDLEWMVGKDWPLEERQLVRGRTVCATEKSRCAGHCAQCLTSLISFHLYKYLMTQVVIVSFDRWENQSSEKSHHWPKDANIDDRTQVQLPIRVSTPNLINHSLTSTVQCMNLSTYIDRSIQIYMYVYVCICNCI